jgi:hypothetical protein
MFILVEPSGVECSRLNHKIFTRIFRNQGGNLEGARILSRMKTSQIGGNVQIIYTDTNLLEHQRYPPITFRYLHENNF